MARLLEHHDDSWYSTETRVSTDPATFKALCSEERWKILELLADQPMYPAAIAKELGVKQQNVYYHMKQLQEQDIIEQVSKEDLGGSMATFYAPTSTCFSLKLPGTESVTDDVPSLQSSQARQFLTPFIQQGSINCRIVVGSPDPHGPHQVRGRDGHLALDLAAFLGRFGSLERNIHALDVDINKGETIDENLILVGGPLTNVVTAEINNHMTVRFQQETFPYRNLISTQTGQEYSDDAVGLIAKMRNPLNPEKFVLVIAGIRNRATQAAMLALTQEHDQLLADYDGEENWATVVKGRDMDGDGKIDEIEILE